jgi:hypothetical protein
MCKLKFYENPSMNQVKWENLSNNSNGQQFRQDQQNEQSSLTSDKWI